jgi:hypothetical protein
LEGSAIETARSDLRRPARALLERVLLAARNRQVERLHMLCLAENQRMQRLARKFNAALSFEAAAS